MQSNKQETKTSREKIFVIRNSPLTDIFENKQTSNLYNVYVIVFTCMLFQNLVKQYMKTGRVNFGLQTIAIAFAKFDRAVLIWLCCFVSTCISFYCFQVWAKLRALDKGVANIWDWFWAISLAFYYFYTFKTTSNAVAYFGFNPPCAAFVAIESVRLLMKVHSFVRNKASEVLQSKQAPPSVNFSNFLYFLFAPTLIYRDYYPRTKDINWKCVLQHLFECISVLFMFSFIKEAAYPSPERFLAKFTIAEIVVFIIEIIPYGALILTGTFLLVLHSVQNLFAEITRFGDRLFYLDWWNEHNYSRWMTKWNLLVRDWLYHYVYRDFKQHVYCSTFLSIFMVFLISYMTHEYIMFCWLGKLFPCFLLVALLVVFPSFYFNTPKMMFFNVFLWCSGCILMSAFIFLYILEHYAITKAPLKNPTLLELIIPRFVTCGCVLKF